MKFPIYQSLINFSLKNKIHFTTPAHKGKVKMRNNVLGQLDVSKNSSLDVKDILTDGEKLIADIFGADKSFYLTGGKDAGVISVLACMCKAGDKVIIDPECDKSFINAITILAIIPIFMKRKHNTKYALLGGIDTEELEFLCERHRDAKAVIIASPTYNGVCANIKKAREIAHSKKMLLMVDESYGAHFNFSDSFPETALECGADIVIHSASDTLGGFSGSGFLHFSGSPINEDALREQLEIYQGGSFSFSSVCITENAVGYAFKNGRKYDRLLDAIGRGKDMLNRNCDILWFDSEYNNGANIDEVDKLKIVLNFSRVNISAKEAYKLLVSKHSIEPDSFLGDNLVFSVSLYNTPDEIRKLCEACSFIGKAFGAKITAEDSGAVIKKRKSAKVLPYKAFGCEGEKVHYMDAEGRLCRKGVFRIPDKSPIIIPGEKITQEHINAISYITKNGSTLDGVDEFHNIEVLSLSDSFGF